MYLQDANERVDYAKSLSSPGSKQKYTETKYPTLPSDKALKKIRDEEDTDQDLPFDEQIQKSLKNIAFIEENR